MLNIDRIMQAGAEFDIFEPGYLRAALEMHPCLGPLIFGQTKWRGLGGIVTPDDDPLTSVFRRRGEFQSYPREHVQLTSNLDWDRLA